MSYPYSSPYRQPQRQRVRQMQAGVIPPPPRTRARVHFSSIPSEIPQQAPEQSVEIEDEGEGSQSKRTPIKKPWYMWAIPIVDSILGVGFEVSMFCTGIGKKNVFHPLFLGKAIKSDVLVVLFVIRDMMEFLLGIALFYGLMSGKGSKTLFFMQFWLQGTYSIFLVQVLLMILINIPEWATTGDIKWIVWINGIDLFVRVILFIVVKYYREKFKLEYGREQRIRYLMEPPSPPPPTPTGEEQAQVIHPINLNRISRYI